jgi:hypothetical protein
MVKQGLENAHYFLHLIENSFSFLCPTESFLLGDISQGNYQLRESLDKFSIVSAYPKESSQFSDILGLSQSRMA